MGSKSLRDIYFFDPWFEPTTKPDRSSGLISSRLRLRVPVKDGEEYQLFTLLLNLRYGQAPPERSRSTAPSRSG